MDDGELDFSNQEVFSSPNMGEIPSSGSMDSFFDELLKDTHACTHTHTCNPPGPDFSHTHTCYHVHTKIIGESESLNVEGFGGCEFENLQCLAGQNLGLKDLRACGVGQQAGSNGSSKRKGGT
uniref:Uncharacterized protein n=1 Tax=Cajanus cajan TaxID=3821 RepID=A0A151TMR8_CAJCA|nr:hypothetical protein KK1_021938 [Cajanus cajan]